MADKYSNILYKSVVQSGTDVLTFDEVSIGLSLFDKVGILIHRLEWYQWHTLLAATTDQVEFGLSTSNGWTVSDSGESSIITFHKSAVRDFGTAGNNQIFKEPWVDDFTTLPGGGLLITPRPLYMFVESANLASATTVKLRMFFTIITLKAEEYFELLETRQFFG